MIYVAAGLRLIKPTDLFSYRFFFSPLFCRCLPRCRHFIYDHRKSWNPCRAKKKPAGHAGFRQRRRWDSNPWLYAHHRTYVRITVHFLACFNRFSIFFCHLVRTCVHGNVPWCTTMQHEMQHEIKMIQYSLWAGGYVLSAFMFGNNATNNINCRKTSNPISCTSSRREL